MFRADVKEMVLAGHSAKITSKNFATTGGYFGGTGGMEMDAHKVRGLVFRT